MDDVKPAMRSEVAPRPTAAQTAQEELRLAAVRRYDILDSPPDGSFARVTALAARLFGVPIAIVSIVDSERIWFKSHHGLDIEELDREPGLCASAVLQYEPWLVADASLDPRTLSHPLVAGEFGLRFYAGMPLTTKDGYNLGTLCVIDEQPREFTEVELETLRDLAAIVMDELEMRRAAIRTHELEAALTRAAEEEAQAARAQYAEYLSIVSASEDKRINVKKLLSDGAPTMVYQPIVDLHSMQIVGAEALTRFAGQEMSTQAWFMEAADVGLAEELELAAVDAALAELPELPGDVYLALNVSPSTMILPQLRTMLKEHAPGRIVLELTEHAVVPDYQLLHRALARLRKDGVRLAVDDAGAGYATLRHILNLRPDIIKLDLELTRGIDGDLTRRALASALLAFAVEIDAVIVAEGIETEAELDTLLTVGVRMGQGYLLGKPAPLPLSINPRQGFGAAQAFGTAQASANHLNGVPIRSS